MGIDASYVMWYRKGLLKLIQQEVSNGHHYIGNDGYKLVRRAGDRYDGDEEGRPSIDFEICETNSRGVSSSSSVYFYYASGVVRVSDGRRYFGEHNEEYNGNAVGFYSELLRNLTRDEDYSYTYCDAYCDVIMEGYYDIDDLSVSDRRDTYDEDTVLTEIPFELMTDEERTRFVAIFGRGTDERHANDVGEALHEGNPDRLMELVKDYDESALNDMVIVACKSKSADCVRALLDRQRIIPPKAFDAAVKNKDCATAYALMKYGYTPDERQLMACAKTDEESTFRMALHMYGRRKRYETHVFPEEKREPTYIGRAHDDDPPDELFVGPDECSDTSFVVPEGVVCFVAKDVPIEILQVAKSVRFLYLENVRIKRLVVHSGLAVVRCRRGCLEEVVCPTGKFVELKALDVSGNPDFTEFGFDLPESLTFLNVTDTSVNRRSLNTEACYAKNDDPNPKNPYEYFVYIS